MERGADYLLRKELVGSNTEELLRYPMKFEPDSIEKWELDSIVEQYQSNPDVVAAAGLARKALAAEYTDVELNIAIEAWGRFRDDPALSAAVQDTAVVVYDGLWTRRESIQAALRGVLQSYNEERNDVVNSQRA